ncbi:hypothetical protein MSSAC_0430 [Methanosarcina siciliae C2J]|uniref:Glutamate-rich protein grpB n=2 Tax=Methanosarcina siciliae TaxID=38027 RepID=A0A0E3PAH2_9EURY|nr:GrpB family protein [Methanosarcina siciliae]AKB31087.1 hypothetical protein MSSIH_0397 [Methanosarcina siciliae HI350]AKB35020.1 hypothetical protein MSSAC_0430 [Methanosarcina siciliae C2J]
MSIGLKRNTVVLESFSPEWEEYFELEKERILGAIKENIISIEHIGSTSIKNSVAKPIIDICIGIGDYSTGFECVKKLESLGYKYLGEYGVEGRHYFRTDSDCVKVHIHMFDAKSDQYLNHILFRDYLNCHPEDLQKYNELKEQLKGKMISREEYTRQKEPLINEILTKAKRWKIREDIEY